MNQDEQPTIQPEAGAVTGHCAACGQPAQGLMANVEEKNPAGEVVRRVQFHEVCFLRNQVAALDVERTKMVSLVGAMLARLGGVARLHKLDFQKSAQVGHAFDVSPQPGDWLLLELHRIVPASGQVLDASGKPVGVGG